MISYLLWLLAAIALAATLAGVLWMIYVGLIIAHASERRDDQW